MMGYKELFKELQLYLKDQKYDDDVCEYILLTFTTLSNYYEEYIEYEPEIIDFEGFLNRYIMALKHAKKFIILRDVNQDQDFVRSIKPTNGIPTAYGYNKNPEGQFIVSSNNPQYYCSLGGLTNKITGDVTILFDDNTRHHPSKLMETLIHELTHVYQSGFDLPWYVMNRDLFIRCLREGHAIRESRYVYKCKNAFYEIPFNYDIVKNEFKSTEIGDYRLYKYLYFKLEMLLGHDFMTKWATREDDNTFLLKAYKLIDAKYGKGTFKKLYQSIQLIFLGLCNFPTEGLKNIVIEQNSMATCYDETMDLSLDNTIDEYQKINGMLHNDELMEKDYEREKDSLLSTREYFSSLNIGSEQSLKKLDEKIQNHTRETHRESLERACENLKEEIDVKTDVKFFKMIALTNIICCQEAIKNPRFLTDAIVALEGLIVKCLLKEMDDHFKSGYENYQRYTYYISNMGNKTFNYKPMINIKKKLNYLSMKTVLQSDPDFFEILNNAPKK